MGKRGHAEEKKNNTSKKLRHLMLGEVRWAVEDLGVDLSENPSVSTQCRRDILAAKEEANGAVEKALEDGALDELGETRVVCCSKDEHVTELTVK